MSNDAKPRKTSPVLATSKSTEGFGARLASRALRKGVNTAKPLVPVTNAGKSHITTGAAVDSRSPRDTETDKIPLNLDASSVAARDGRQFTVSNVGNNGRIYLRYVQTLYLAVGMLVEYRVTIPTGRSELTLPSFVGRLFVLVINETLLQH